DTYFKWTFGHELIPRNRRDYRMGLNGHQAVEARLRSELACIQGLPCWYVCVGGGTLPSFSLALGKKIKRDVPLTNDAHPPEYRENDPEISFLVWCSWRLANLSAVGIVSSSCSDEQIEKDLPQLVGQQIESVVLKAPFWDLDITFSGRLHLSTFSDNICSHGDTIDGNWESHSKERVVSIGSGAKWEIQKR
ncbi:hypothetical protein ACFLQU_04925, partial [Verrucomicrobiota bacterium]